MTLLGASRLTYNRLGEALLASRKVFNALLRISHASLTMRRGGGTLSAALPRGLRGKALGYAHSRLAPTSS